MARRRNTTIEIAAPPEATRKLTAAQKLRILKLHDTPFTVREISAELNIPVDTVREALVEMTPWMN